MHFVSVNFLIFDDCLIMQRDIAVCKPEVTGRHHVSTSNGSGGRFFCTILQVFCGFLIVSIFLSEEKLKVKMNNANSASPYYLGRERQTCKITGNK